MAVAEPGVLLIMVLPMGVRAVSTLQCPEKPAVLAGRPTWPVAELATKEILLALVVSSLLRRMVVWVALRPGLGRASGQLG